MLKIFRLYPFSFCLITLAFIIFLSYGQATNFALWQDDNALIFKLQHLEEQAGVFGAGPFGLGAYRYISVPYIPIYKIFYLNTAAFYIWAIFFYFLASVSIFFLARALTKNNLLSLLSGAIFAAGYVGSDGILRLFNSIQTSYSVIFICLLFIFLYRFTTTKKASDYILALVFFFIALETAFIRTQYLILPTILFFALFITCLKSFSGVVSGILSLSPFLAAYLFLILKYPDPRSALVWEFVQGLLSGTIQYAHSFFGTIGNIVLPNPLIAFLFSQTNIISKDLTNKSILLETVFLIFFIFLLKSILRKEKIVVRVGFTLLEITWFILQWAFFHDSELLIRHSITEHAMHVFANFIGGSFLIICAAVILVVLKKNQRVGFSLIFFLSWLLSNILVYSTYIPFTPFETFNRYLVHSLAGYALFITLIMFTLLGKKAVIFLSLIIVMNIGFSIDYQHRFIIEKSVPTKKFYNDLKSFLPQIPKGAILYFDIAADEVSEQQFRDFFSVASMPNETAIAIRYGIDRYDLTITSNFEEFITLLEGKPLDLAYSFFYNSEDLKNTTNLMRSNLSAGGKIEIDLKKIGDLSLITPAVLEFRAKAIPKISIQQNCPIFPGDRNIFFHYLLSRDAFYKEVSVKTNSHAKYQTTDFLTDGKTDTFWRGHRGWWHEQEKDEVLLDLGKIKSVGQLLWVNAYANSTPVNYSIEASVDGIYWQSLKKIMAGKKDNNQLIIENFNPLQTRFIKVVIEDTFDNDSPAIGEIEVIENEFIHIDKNQLSALEKYAFCIGNELEKDILLEFIRKRGLEATISWKTDKSIDNVVRLNLQVDSLYHNYKVVLPAGGTKLNELRIEPGLIPAKISVAGIRVTYPSKEELVKMFGLQIQ